MSTSKIIRVPKRRAKSSPFPFILFAGVGGGTTTVTLDIIAPVDVQATLRGTARTPVEFSRLVNSDALGRLEFGGSGVSARFPIEFSNGLLSTARTPLEFETLLNADILPREEFGNAYNVGIRSPVDFGVSERSDILSPIAISATLQAQQHGLIEWTGVLQLTIDIASPIDIRATLNSDALGLIEEAATLSATSKGRLEFGGSGTSARFPIEFGGSARSEILAPIEWSSTSNTVIASERLPIEWGARLSADIVSPPASLATPQIAARAQIDFMATMVASCRGRIDWGQSLRADVLAPMALLASLYGQARSPAEWKAAPTFFGLNPRYLTAPDGRQYLITPVARIYHIVPVRRTRGN